MGNSKAWMTRGIVIPLPQEVGQREGSTIGVGRRYAVFHLQHAREGWLELHGEMPSRRSGMWGWHFREVKICTFASCYLEVTAEAGREERVAKRGGVCRGLDVLDDGSLNFLRVLFFGMYMVSSWDSVAGLTEKEVDSAEIRLRSL